MLQVLSCFSVILDYVNYKCCFCQGHFIRSCFPLEIHLFAVVLYCMCYNISTSVSQTIKMLPHVKVQTALQKFKKNWQRIIHNVAVASLHSYFYVEPHGST